MNNEGWNVLQFVPGGRQTVVEIRAKIADFKRIQPDLRSVFILGHVKVPYSGNLNPDGHPDHMGAWPSDTYYADIDGLWTDITEDNSVASRQANKNIPGDGKFDQSVLPSDADLEVGRVDFYDMPAFSKTEIQLLRNYLNKNHLWRTGQIKAERRGIVQDNFNFQNEAFGQSGIKNFNSFYGPNNVYYQSYRDSLLKKSYTWSFGAGPGNYSGASGISSTENMAKDSLQTVFTFLFGSYFGDWDSQNNFLRAALASGTVLTNAWSGRPLWTVHHMGLGEHIGYSTRLSMNNSSTYTAGYSARGVHIALMGDPSLALFPWVGSPSLELVESGPHVDLRWRTVAEATDGYTVYRKTEGNTTFDVLARNVKDTTYRDKCLYPGFKYEYMVRASKLETTSSGSFYNMSTGVRNSITKAGTLTPKADFDYTLDYEFLHLKSKSKNSNSVFYVIGKDSLKNPETDYVLPCPGSNAVVCLIAKGECEDDMKCSNLPYTCSVPDIKKLKIDSISCHGGTGGIEILDLTGADPFIFNWSTGGTGNAITGVKAGMYQLTIRSAKNTEQQFSFLLTEPEDIQVSFKVRGANPGKADGGLENILIQGGTPPYIYKIQGKQIDSLAVGNYELLVTDAKGCEKRIPFKVDVRTASEEEEATADRWIYPVPAGDELHLLIPEGILVKRIQLVDVHGAIRNEYDVAQKILNLRGLSPGWYAIRFMLRDGTFKAIGFEKH